jgi:hypothetical protein
MCCVVIEDTDIGDTEIVTLCGGTARRICGTHTALGCRQLRQGRFHFRASMLIAGPASHFDTAAESPFGFDRSRKARQKLAVLEIARHIVGVFSKQLFEIGYGRLRISLIGAFHGQAVTREGVLRMRSNEFFE